MKLRLKAVKRAVSFILALTMVVTMLPQAGLSSYADEVNDVSSNEEYVETSTETVEETTEESSEETTEQSNEETEEEIVYNDDVSSSDVSSNEPITEIHFKDGISTIKLIAGAKLDVSQYIVTGANTPVDASLLNFEAKGKYVKFDGKYAKVEQLYRNEAFRVSLKENPSVYVDGTFEIYSDEEIKMKINVPKHAEIVDVSGGSLDEEGYIIYNKDFTLSETINKYISVKIKYDFDYTYNGIYIPEVFGVGPQDILISNQKEKYINGTVINEYVTLDICLGLLLIASNVDNTGIDIYEKENIESLSYRYLGTNSIPYVNIYWDGGEIPNGKFAKLNSETTEVVLRLNTASDYEFRKDNLKIDYSCRYYDVSENERKTVTGTWDVSDNNVEIIDSHNIKLTVNYTEDETKKDISYWINAVTGAAYKDYITAETYLNKLDIVTNIYEWSKDAKGKDVLTKINYENEYLDYDKKYVVCFDVKGDTAHYDPIITFYKNNDEMNPSSVTISGKSYILLSEGNTGNDYYWYYVELSEKVKDDSTVTLTINKDLADCRIFAGNDEVKGDVSGSDVIYTMFKGQKITVKATAKTGIVLTSLALDGSTIKDKSISKTNSIWTTSFTATKNSVLKISGKYTYDKGLVTYHRTSKIPEKNGVYILDSTKTDSWIRIAPHYNGPGVGTQDPVWSKAVIEIKGKKYTVNAESTDADVCDWLLQAGHDDYSFCMLFDADYSKLAGKSFNVTLYGNRNGVEEKIYTYKFVCASLLSSVKVSGARNGKITQTAGTVKKYNLSFNKNASTENLKVISSDNVYATLSDDKTYITVETLLKDATATVDFYDGEKKISSLKIESSTKAYTKVTPTFKINNTTDIGVDGTIGSKNDINNLSENVHKFFVIELTCNTEDVGIRPNDKTSYGGTLTTKWEDLEGGKTKVTMRIYDGLLKEYLNYRLECTLKNDLLGTGKACKYDMKIWIEYKDNSDNTLKSKTTNGTIKLKDPYYSPTVKVKELCKNTKIYPFAKNVKVATISYDSKTTYYGYNAVDTSYSSYGALEFLDDGDAYSLTVVAGNSIAPGIHTVEITPIAPEGTYVKPVTIKINVAYPISCIDKIKSQDYVYKEIGKAASFTANIGSVYYVDYSFSKPSKTAVKWYVTKSCPEDVSEISTYMFTEGDSLYNKVSVSAKGVVTINKTYDATVEGESFYLVAVANDYADNRIFECKEIVISSQPRKYYKQALVSYTRVPLDEIKCEISNEGIINEQRVKADEIDNMKMLLAYDYYGSYYLFAEQSDVKYSSSNTKVATIDKDGIITIKKAVTKDTKVTFKAVEKNGKKRTFSITVTIVPYNTSASDIYLNYYVFEPTERTNDWEYDRTNSSDTIEVELLGNNNCIAVCFGDELGEALNCDYTVKATGAELVNVEKMLRKYNIKGLDNNACYVIPNAKKITLTLTIGKTKKTFTFENKNFVSGKTTIDKKVKNVYMGTDSTEIVVKVDKKYAGKDVCLYSDMGFAASDISNYVIGYSFNATNSKDKTNSSLSVSKVDDDGNVVIKLSDYTSMAYMFAVIKVMYGVEPSGMMGYNLAVIDSDNKPISTPYQFKIKFINEQGATGKNDFTPTTSYTLNADVTGNGEVQVTKKAGTNYKSEVVYTGIKAVNVNGKYADIKDVITISRTGLISCKMNDSYDALIQKYGTSLKVQIFYTVIPMGCLPIETSSTITINFKKR